MKIIVKTLAGLEEALKEEIQQICQKQVTVLVRAVMLEDGQEDDIYLINYLSRLATHVLIVIKEGEVYNEDDLYHFALKTPWDDYLTTQHTFAINPTINSNRFRHTGFAALKVKDAIADYFMEVYKRRPDVDKETPDLPINIHIHNKNASLSINTSGMPLFRRGYKLQKGIAPINEVLAAGLVKLSGWNMSEPLYDPMCGTGSIALEAAMMIKQIPAQKFRKSYAFENFPFLQRSKFTQLRKDWSRPESLPFEHKIFASDSNKYAVRTAQKNAQKAKVASITKVFEADFFLTEKPAPSGTIIMNPPYDERLELDDAIDFYKNIGDHLKQAYTGWKAWVLSANVDAIKHLGLKPFKKYTVYNGKLECTFRGYEMY